MYHNRRHCNPELFTLPKPQPRPPRDLFERTVSSSIGPAVLGTQRKLALIATEQGVIFPENSRPQALIQRRSSPLKAHYRKLEGAVRAYHGVPERKRCIPSASPNLEQWGKTAGDKATILLEF